MELKPGYKQTVAGVIPEEWELKRLGELASVTAGGTPSRINPRYWHGDIPWVTTSELGSATIKQAKQSITAEGLKYSAARLLPPGTLLMALYGQGKTRGKIGVLGIEAATNQACAAISLNKNILSTFIFHYLASQYEAIRNLSNTGNQENLNGSIVRSVWVSLPPEPEQRAIAEALSDVDALIGALDQLIAKKRDLKQAATQQLLTARRRLPGFDGPWETKAIGGLLNACFSGQTPSRTRRDFYEGHIRWITSGELDYNVIIDTAEHISREAMERTGLKLLPRGTFLMAITGLEAEGTSGSCGIVGEPSTTNQSCMALFPKAALRVEYLFHYYVFRGKALALQYCQGTKQQSYTAKLVKSLPILLPPSVDEQVAIVSVLSDMDAEVSALEQRRDKTRALKQGMMQQLLTGATRLV